MAKCDIRPKFECQNRIFDPSSNFKIGFRIMSECDNRPKFECQSRISNVKMRYSARMSKNEKRKDNVQRLTKVVTRRLARQDGLTPEPKPVTPQPSAPCPEVLSHQVTARRVGPPPSSQTTAESYGDKPKATAPHTTGTTQLPRQGLPPVSRQGQQTRQSVRSRQQRSRYRRSVQQSQRTTTLRQVLSTNTEKLRTEGAMYPLNGKQHTISANNCLTAKP